jgi:MazG family protein
MTQDKIEEVLSSFKKLLEVAHHLMGPNGCAWDREQTVLSMRGSLLEEAYEMLEAIDEGDNHNLSEELGDLLYNIIFFCILGEKESRLTTVGVIQGITAKLIERHPHVFGEKKLEDLRAIERQWEEIKKKKRESLLDGIPKALPGLTKGSKMVNKMKRSGYPQPENSAPYFETQEELGKLLWGTIAAAREKGLDPEHALQEELFRLGQQFREWEKKDN